MDKIISKELIGSVWFLTYESGKKSLELSIDGSSDIFKSFRALIDIQAQEDANKEHKGTDLAVFFEGLFERAHLPLNLYQIGRYSGCRALKDNKSLVYWNYNRKTGFLNISSKDFLIRQFKHEKVLTHIHWGREYDDEDEHVLQQEKWIYVPEEIEQNALSSMLENFIRQFGNDCIEYQLKYNLPEISEIKSKKRIKLLVSLNKDWWQKYEKDLALWSDPETNIGEIMEYVQSDEDSKASYLEAHPYPPLLDFSGFIEQAITSGLVIGTDEDNRFPKTTRIKLNTVELIEEFFERLASNLEAYVAGEIVSD